MANKKSIQDVDAALDEWHRKLNTAVRRINDLRELRKKLITGKVKHPPPKGVKIKLFTDGEPRSEFDDPIPSFGTGSGFGH
jgi:hypothetical protein